MLLGQALAFGFLTQGNDQLVVSGQRSLAHQGFILPIGEQDGYRSAAALDDEVLLAGGYAIKCAAGGAPEVGGFLLCGRPPLTGDGEKL